MAKELINDGAILRHERELRNWSQQELVKRILALCAKDDGYPALTTKTVGRWERGECKPSPYYRALLCQMFGRNAIQLGFISHPESERRVETAMDLHLPSGTQTIGRNHQGPLVGREKELSALEEWIRTLDQQARKPKKQFHAIDAASSMQFAILTGDAGIGKTRLAEEVGRVTLEHGWEIMWGHAYAQETTVPYRIWTEILRKAVALGISHQPDVQKNGTSLPLLSALLPELRDVLPQPSSPLHSPKQEQLWEAIYQMLVTISVGLPLLIVLDDLQWADSGSYHLLAYLARRLQGHPLFLLATCRESELGSSSPLRFLLTSLEREGCLTRLPLTPLANDHIRTLVSTIHPLSDPLVQQIQQRAAGNPYFTEELIRAFATSLPVPASAPQTSAQRDTSLVTLPESIASLLAQRLARLSLPCQSLLAKAAILGGSFEISMLCALEERTSGLPANAEGNVLDLLDEAVYEGLLTEDGAGKQIVYHFWHPLLVDHLQEQLSAGRRALYHRKVASILQEWFGQDNRQEAAKITHHLVLGGGGASDIALYAELAGSYAYALSTYPEAEYYFQLALDSLRQLPGEACTPTPFPGHHARKADLLELLGECTRVQGKDEEAQRWYEAALAVRSTQRFSATPEEEQEAAQVRSLLWCEIGYTWYNRANLAQAKECYHASSQVLRDANISTGLAWAYHHYRQSYVCWLSGMYEEALALASEALRLQEDACPPHPQQPEGTTSFPTMIQRTLAGDPVNRGRISQLLGMITNGMGRYQETIEHWRTACTIFEQYQSTRDLAIVNCNLGSVHLRKADYAAAQATLQQALTLAEQIGEIPLVSTVLANLGILAIRRGALTEAEMWLRKAVTRAEQANSPLERSALHAYLSIALREQANLSEAKSSVYHALTIARTLRIAPYLGTALVALAALRFAQANAILERKEETPASPLSGDQLLKRSRRSLEHALSLSEIESQTKVEARLLLAQVLASLGEKERAQRLAEQALEEATRCELVRLVAEAQGVLGKILSAQGKQEQATLRFQQALQLLDATGMRLEYARTLHAYGEMLLCQTAPAVASTDSRKKRGKSEEDGNHHLAYHYLKKANEIFKACGAQTNVSLLTC